MSLPNLFVVKVTICASKRIDAGTVAQTKEKALPLSDTKCNRVGNGSDVMRVQRLFPGHLL